MSKRRYYGMSIEMECSSAFVRDIMGELLKEFVKKPLQALCTVCIYERDHLNYPEEYTNPVPPTYHVKIETNLPEDSRAQMLAIRASKLFHEFQEIRDLDIQGLNYSRHLTRRWNIAQDDEDCEYYPPMRPN